MLGQGGRTWGESPDLKVRRGNLWERSYKGLPVPDRPGLKSGEQRPVVRCSASGHEWGNAVFEPSYGVEFFPGYDAVVDQHLVGCVPVT